jgi:GT2 family glycosyltransferase
MDERFFLYYEEPDLCLRMLHGGWETRYLPIMTVLHHGGEVSMTPRLMAQHAFSGRLYLRKHVGGMRRVGSLLALALGHAVRSVPPVADRESRRANRYAFLILMGLGEAPFGDPPVEASTPR